MRCLGRWKRAKRQCTKQMGRHADDDDVDDDDPVLRRVRAERHAVDETLDFLGMAGRKRGAKDASMDVDSALNAAVLATAKRSRASNEVMDAMRKLSLAFDIGQRHGSDVGASPRRRRGAGGAPTTRASGSRRVTLDLGLQDMQALDGANAMAEELMEDAERGRSLELEVRRPRDGTAWLLERALRGTLGSASSSERLVSLTLRGGKGLSAEGFGTLIRALGDARALRKLDLSSCGLGSRAGEELAAVLDENGCPLERLDLRGNLLGAEGAIALSSALATSKSLKALNMAQNLIGADGMRALASALAGEDGSGSSIEELDVQHNGFGDDGCAAIAQHGLGNLERLFLGFNGIGAAGAKEIADALRKRHRETQSEDESMECENDPFGERATKYMRKLDLKCNAVGSEGAHALADTLDAVEDLDLSNNSIRDGSKWLAKSLKSRASQLKELNLQANEMNDDDAWYLADAIGANTTLKSLNLGSNALGDPGASDLAADLRENSALETLDLTRNAIGKEGATELMNAMDENKTLTRLGLESNLIPAETTTEIKRRVGLRAQCDWQRAGFSSDKLDNAPMKFS